MGMPKENTVVRKIYFFLETEHGINKENSSLGSFLLHYIGHEKVSVPKNYNRGDCGVFSIANATELAFNWDLGTVRGVSTDRRCFLAYLALRHLYRPVELDWFSYYRSFQRTY